MTRQATLRPLDEAECLRLIAGGGVGRLAHTGRFGLTVLPVNYKVHETDIVFRTAQGSPMVRIFEISGVVSGSLEPAKACAKRPLTQRERG